jgi:serine/threonine-protein kinase RsbW
MQERRLALAADPDGARDAAVATRSLLDGYHPDVVNACELAVAEACANVVEHAYAGSGGSLRVVLRIRSGRFAAAICDTGPPFDGAAHPVTHPHPTAPSGRGLALLGLLMDRHQWRRVQDENRLLMVRDLDREAA